MFHQSVANACVASHPRIPVPVADAIATPVSSSLTDVGNIPPLELLAELASREAPMAAPSMQAHAMTAADVAFAEHLLWCNPPLGVALEWGRAPLPSGERSKATLSKLSEAVGIPPPTHLVRMDGALSRRGETVRRYTQAAFDFCGLPANAKQFATVDAIASDRQLKRHDVLRYVPARELVPALAVDPRDEAARRAANVEIIRHLEQVRPDFTGTDLWKAIVDWCGKPDRARWETDMALFAYARGVERQRFIQYVTPAGDLTAHVLELPEGSTKSKKPQAPEVYAGRKSVSKAQRVALDWRERCLSGQVAPGESLTHFAQVAGVPPTAAMNYVTSNGAWKDASNRP